MLQTDAAFAMPEVSRAIAEDPDHYVRVAAAYALVHISDSPIVATAVLCDCCANQRSWRVKTACVQALGLFAADPLPAAECLASACEWSESLTVVEAARALRTLGESAAPYRDRLEAVLTSRLAKDDDEIQYELLCTLVAITGGSPDLRAPIEELASSGRYEAVRQRARDLLADLK